MVVFYFSLSTLPLEVSYSVWLAKISPQSVNVHVARLKITGFIIKKHLKFQEMPLQLPAE